MSNYNEALDSEKRTLSLLVETNFYGPQNQNENPPGITPQAIIQALQDSPELSHQLRMLLYSGAAIAV